MTSQRSALFTAETQTLLAAFMKGVQHLWAMAIEQRNRNAMASLLSSDDWQFQDLGVQREDVLHVLQLPLSESASRELERMRQKCAQG